MGWSGGATVLNKFPVPGRPINLDDSRTRAWCGWGGCLDIFLSSILSLFFLLSGRRPHITEKLSQMAVKPTTTNQPAATKQPNSR